MNDWQRQVISEERFYQFMRGRNGSKPMCLFTEIKAQQSSNPSNGWFELNLREWGLEDVLAPEGFKGSWLQCHVKLFMEDDSLRMWVR